MTDEETKIVEGMDDLKLEKKEKKKKKKTKDTGDAGDLDLAEKPKKKKKEKKADDGAGPSLDLDLGAKKKKTKKTKKSSKDEDGDENDAEAGAGELDLTLDKKKKKKDKGKKKDGPKAIASTWGNMEQLNKEDMAAHGYDELLTRVFDKMETMGVGKGSKGSKRIVCKPPMMVRIGTKKSGYQNFGQTCDDLKRSTKHVMQYILHETGTSGNLDITNQLIMRGRFKPAHMENVLRDYIKEYVQCTTCKSANTSLDKIDRLTFMNCHDCSSRRTVASMQAGFQAVVGKRKKLREKQGIGAGNAAAL